MYTERDLVRVAKRENNLKRSYLVVNTQQAKHIPVSPGKTLAMIDELADMVRERYPKERLLLVGFAETATAIGAEMAVSLNSYYIQTTREKYEGVEYLDFTESHSHATEQKLAKKEIESCLEHIRRIVFVEDEVTTGNTILKIINLIEELYPGKVTFSVASLLNGMEQESIETYAGRHIDIMYLVKTNHRLFAEMASEYKGDGIYHQECLEIPHIEIHEKELDGYCNTRFLVEGQFYEKACQELCQQIEQDLDFSLFQNILVLGTEEFMYPSIFVAKKIEEHGKCVRCHATTRSPIVVSKEPEYPVHERYELVSLYEDERRTFLYELKKYDCVVIITDAERRCSTGVNSLINALEICGNSNIYLYRWC